MSPPRIPYQKTQTKTPKKSSDPSTSSTSLRDGEKCSGKDQGQGDGFHNPIDLPVSPAKRFKPAEGDFLENDVETVEGESDATPRVKYMTAEGSIEFHRPSIKKLQAETKWKRPCKLSVAYSSVNCHDCTIYLIIYEGNVKCRRNLMKDFEAEEPEKWDNVHLKLRLSSGVEMFHVKSNALIRYFFVTCKEKDDRAL